jgi:heat shock protein HslJ
MNGKKIPPTDNNQDAYIFLRDKKDELIGFTGCNNISGEYEDGKFNAIGFEAIAGTEKACLAIETEAYLLTALKRANRYLINGENMLLYNDNVVLAVFEAK